MSTSGENHKINLKDYPAPSGVSDSQTVELINGKVSQCPAIKGVTPNPDLGLALLKGSYYNYTVEHKRERIHIKPKINYGFSVILSAFSVPFAVWFGYAMDFTQPFTSFALPLSLLLISFGIAWFIGYTLGDKEQKVILTYIYNVLNGKSANASVENAKGIGANKLGAIIPLILGIAALVAFFVMR